MRSLKPFRTAAMLRTRPTGIYTQSGSNSATGPGSITEPPYGRWLLSLFPRVEFCGDAPGQLQSLTGNERYFQWLINCLFDADRECSRWTAGQFPHSALPGPASGESKPVHDNPELRKHRMFRMLTGELLMFEHHMKNKAENKRIHYLVDESRRRIIIAYVGDKLPTGNYRT